MPKKASSQNQYDLAIAGGGLAGGLVALALHEMRPELNIALIEADEHFGGNHIWSFFESDIEPEDRWLLDPLISRQWENYDVQFPQYHRTIGNGYYSIESENLDRELRKKLPAEALKSGLKAKSINDGLVRLENGDEIAAKAVLDVRGGGDFSALEYGWQKFCGQMLRLKEPHGLQHPIIMDATVEQIDGYRFVYCLPFSATEIFIEDTYYSDTKDLAIDVLHERIAQYAAEQGWIVDQILREERGTLPVLYGGNFAKFWRSNKGPDARAGTRAALIQPITSYSLPMAVRTAMLIAQTPEIDQPVLDKLLKNLATKHWKDGKFYRMLCAFMFKGADPDKRYRTLQHTYTKDEKLLARFYAGRTTKGDQLNLLTGKPPIPISRAIPLLLKYR
ncbi:lycopene beta-cyclase CrtY [Parasphingorhabdus cellanae]|uniref:Lycopene beta-cyclase CrtY n=1 Tax=Parasphingorhabdus cellanae TaxID=2806553 RepID=A0ABX7T7I2_9SPHN|nr:lycopene beta-cyclase CrtY [Parasphingorhabdus cellanae]QTD56752.1 lycopene beta-cyclase CrtY [Parasphingorhabdus cellanae]